MVRVDAGAAAAMASGLDRIRAEVDIPDAFPPEVVAAAERAASRPVGAQSGHVDRTALRFATLDPASSIDLDQAFAIEVAGTDIVLHYAIADVGWFVQPGDPLDVEAFRRGVTVYLPDRRATLYPPVLSESAASLLPNVDRPAVVFTVRVDESGESTIDGVERALVRSTAKLAYDDVSPADLPPGFEELHRRIVAAEERRGAPRVEFPEQEISVDGNGDYSLTFRPRLASEEQNAAMSLATNLAVAKLLFAAGTGLFREMPSVDERHLRRLRNSARAFGLDWPGDVALDEFERSLPRADPRSSAFLMAVRRAAGGASYAPFVHGHTPWHSAMAATYAQATAPLRRLQDRYVIEATLAVANGKPVPDDIAAAFERLPNAMALADQRAARAEREAIALTEAVVLSDCVGQTFRGVVVDESEYGVEVQLESPAVLARVKAKSVDPGDDVVLRLVAVDIDARRVEFERVG
jgi:exoribonuclease R